MLRVKSLEKAIAGIVIGVTLFTGSAANLTDYYFTMNRLRELGGYYSQDSKNQVESELKLLNNNLDFNKLRLGYRLALEFYLQDCESAENPGII